MARHPRKSRTTAQIIDIDNDASCHFWTRALGVNLADLKRAVREVGGGSEDVRHYLAVKHHRQVERESTT